MDEQSSFRETCSRRPHTYTIGYAMMPNRPERDTFTHPSLVDLTAQRGIRLVAIDASRSFAAQGPFDLLVHKLYEQPWRAHLEAFCALHPWVPVVDPPGAMDRLVDRATMIDAVSGLDVASLGVPSQVVVRDAADLAIQGLLGADLRFPLIAKPVDSWVHDMALVYRRDGLRSLSPPLVLQEFVNRGGVLFKVYVVGDHATCVTRCSLPDVPGKRLQDLAADSRVRFSSISLLSTPAAATDHVMNNAKMPPDDFVSKVARELRRALGLHLFNFDMIRARDHDLDGKHLILDIYYCPVYSKMPGFEFALTEFFLKMLHSRPVHGQPDRPGPVLNADARDAEL